ncbi:MAG: lysophospholipid acyltransferase family protein [Candidatus Rifleibacteriota bacterium]
MSGLEPLKKIVLAVSKAAGFFPENYGRALAAASGLALYTSWGTERRRIQNTIDRISYRLGKKLCADTSLVVKRVFVHFSLNIYELMRFPWITKAELDKKVIFHGIENLERALKSGRGVIFVLPHIGNWEMLGAAIAHRGYPLNSFYLSQKEDELGSLLDYFRGFSGIKLHDRDRGGIKALKALKKGEILGMLADQDGANMGVYLDFLGHFVSVPAGPANWSLKTGAIVVPMYSLRRGLSGTFDAVFLPGLADEKAAAHQQKVIDRTRKICSWMESLILKYPHQYLWFYDRFKPRHEGWLAAAKRKSGQMVHGQAWYGS